MENTYKDKDELSQPSVTLSSRSDEDRCWFVLRDLKRTNAKLPAYKMLEELGVEVFTPMIWKLIEKSGRRIRVRVPFMQDLLFVHSSRKMLDPIIDRINTLQYRYVRGGNCLPMTVRTEEMERFIRAVEATDMPHYYMPSEIDSSMFGKEIRIIGGPLNGYVGKLQKMQGSRVKRLFVDLPNLLIASVEVQPEFIQVIEH